MLNKVIYKVRTLDRNFVLFLLVGVCLGLGQSVEGSTLTNFLKEKFQMAIMHRSLLEIPREFPGFLVFLIIGMLYLLGDVRIAFFANLCAAAGMFFLGIIPSDYFVMLIFIFIYSLGVHVYMPLSNSIAMGFANDGRLGRKLGQVSAANTAALVVSSAILWALYKYLNLTYSTAFFIGSAAFFAAAVLMLFMTPKKNTSLKSRFVFRKEYRLYYWLSLLYGARKQIFITFGPWVLVDVFKQKVTTMTILFFIVSVAGIFVKPLTGYLIDCIGEKIILGSEAVILFFVCLGYAFAQDILPLKAAVLLVSICYIIDQVLNAAGMARATYLKKIAVCEEDVSSSLSIGISIDHIVSMFLPSLAGYVWYSSGNSGYKYVFLGGAIIAVINYLSILKMKMPENKVQEV